MCTVLSGSLGGAWWRGSDVSRCVLYCQVFWSGAWWSAVSCVLYCQVLRVARGGGEVTSADVYCTVMFSGRRIVEGKGRQLMCTVLSGSLGGVWWRGSATTLSGSCSPSTWLMTPCTSPSSQNRKALASKHLIQENGLNRETYFYK